MLKIQRSQPLSPPLVVAHIMVHWKRINVKMSLPKSQRNQSTRTGQRDQGQGHHGEGGGRVDLPVQSEN